MQKGPAAIGLLVVALLLGTWGNVMAACVCPLMNHSCQTGPSHMPVLKQQSSCQHEMPMTVDGLIMEKPSDNVSDCSILESPNKQFRFMYSQSLSGTAMVVAVDQARRLIEADAPLDNSAIALSLAFPIPINPLEHGPPGILFPRHLLISVFRV